MVSLSKLVRTVSFRIGALLTLSGAISLIVSFFNGSAILAFIGLGLIFWGLIFLSLKPKRYVEGFMLESVAISEYSTIDRIIRDFKYEGNGYYVPPFPSVARVPEFLRALSDSVVFVSAKKDFEIPSVKSMVEGKFLLSKSRGVFVSPPGFDLLIQIENQSRISLAPMDPAQICEILSRYVTENFSLAKTMEIQRSENEVTLKLSDSMFTELYYPEKNLVSVGLIGCPIVSALACALALSTGRFVTVDKHVLSPNRSTLEVWYRLI